MILLLRFSSNSDRVVLSSVPGALVAQVEECYLCDPRFDPITTPGLGAMARADQAIGDDVRSE